MVAKSSSRSPTDSGRVRESWADLLRGCKRRGMQPPVLAVGDGALGFWKAVRDVFPRPPSNVADSTNLATFSRPCRSRRIRRRGRALAEIYNAEDKTHAKTAAKLFVAEFGGKWPKAAAKISDDLDVLLAFYDYPAEHWIHLRTTNPIESTFATVRLRQRVTKGPGSRAAGVAMAFKLIESAQTRWRCVNAPHLVPLVRAGATFVNGKLVERPINQDHQGGGHTRLEPRGSTGLDDCSGANRPRSCRPASSSAATRTLAL